MLGLGFTIVGIALIGAIVLVVDYFVSDTSVRGWPALFISLWLIAGILIILLGLIGAYVGKIYESVKSRPTYIVQETFNIETNDKNN